MRIAGLVTVAIRRHGAWRGTRRRAGVRCTVPARKIPEKGMPSNGFDEESLVMSL